MPTIDTVHAVPEVIVTWLKVDDGLPDHPKFVALSNIAARLWLHASCWSSRKLTDGRIPHAVIANLLPNETERARKSAATELVDAGIFHAEKGAWTIHDFLDYNPSRKKTLKKRKKNADRLRRWRKDKERERNARETPLQDASKRVSNAAPDPDPDPLSTTTSTYCGADAPPFPQSVHTSDRKASSVWKRSLAIAHAVIDDWPDNPENWRPETKTRMLQQHIDPGGFSPRGDRLFLDAVAFATEQRRQRAARARRAS